MKVKTKLGFITLYLKVISAHILIYIVNNFIAFVVYNEYESV